MQGQLYQVSYLGATYYAVPVYYPGSVVFQSWYLIAYVNGMLVPYTIVPGNAVVVLYNPYLGSAVPAVPGTPTPPASPGTPTAGVLTLNGLTGTLTIAASGGIVVSQLGSTISLVGSGGTTTGLTQAQADVLYVPIPTGTPAPGVPAATVTDPLPQYVSGLELHGSTYREQATAPTSPVVGQLWKNTSASTVAGIPTQNYGVWNGTEWTNLGTRPYPTSTDIFGDTYKEQATAPTSPVNGQIWQNTSGSTVAGVPAGQYAVWNGTAWVPSGTTSPFLTSDKAVTSVNTLKGDVVLTGTSNVIITPSGQNLGISIVSGFSSVVAPVAPYPGQVWYNASTTTISTIPAGNFAVWNGSVWIGVGSSQPQGTLRVSTTAPTTPTPGTVWQNISGGTLIGIPAGHVGVWNGIAWINVIYVPNTVSVASSRIGFLVTFANFTPPGPIPDTGVLLVPSTKVYDTFNAFNLATSVYTVPTSQEGRWLWDVGCAVFNQGTAFNIFTAVNATAVGVTDVLHTSGATYAALGSKPMLLNPGDLLRFYVNGAPGPLNTASFYGTAIQQVG